LLLFFLHAQKRCKALKRSKHDPQKEALKRAKHLRRVAVLGDKDDSVRLLEDLVFGTEEQLLDSLGQVHEPGGEGEGSCDEDAQPQQPIRRAAWVDEDDELEEDVDVTHRFRRDLVKGGEASLSKAGLQQRMKERSVLGPESSGSDALPKGILQMKKCSDLNLSRPTTDSLTSVQFHPSAQVAMTTGVDRSVSLFQVRPQEDGEVFVWDLRSSRCLNTFTDDGCVKSTSMAASPNGRYLATGSVLVSVVSSAQTSEEHHELVTPCTALSFSPSSELLALGSRATDEALKLLHVPSLSVFSNFPVSKRKICYKVQDVAFSPHGGYFCLANNKGRAPLYR
uniref:Uncharacterized protein n=1 Tax=Neogobius melanostomus TaxID=47308 RepID=A0A8C6T987_9GOBI